MKKVNAKLIVELGIAVLIVGALAAGLVYFGFIISDNVREIELAKQDLASRATTLLSFATLRSQYNAKGKAYSNVLNNVIPSYDQLLDVSKEIRSVAATNNLGFGFRYSGEKPATAATLGSIGFEANLSGDFNQIFKFVEDFENLKFLNALSGFDFSRQGGVYQAVLRGQVYFR